ncbi:MAG: hypothetical protein C4560_09745 [Nitrospiraceae bacterium]|nr:MAG: hypothetical protein C4560_09745 [Nitrospiraceae bacterium]
MTDIHTHILPGVDDGAEDIKESLQLLRHAEEEGIRRVVTTPHVYNISDMMQREKIENAFNQLKEAALMENIRITLIWGAELMIDYRIISEIEMLHYYTINREGRFVLLELPMHEIPPYTQSVIYELMLEGVTPIIAHPERNASIIMNHEKLEELLLKGAMAQLNAGSLLGEYGNKVRKTSELLLKKGYISFIGSDVHSYSKNRGPMLNAADIMSKFISDDEIEKIFHSNTDRMVESKHILNRSSAVN